VNAVSSILNLGSPRPPELMVPDGLETCCKLLSARMKSSICVLVVVSRPRVYRSMIVLKTSEESRVHVNKYGMALVFVGDAMTIP
jgi:hypothetical protein